MKYFEFKGTNEISYTPRNNHVIEIRSLRYLLPVCLSYDISTNFTATTDS